MLACIVKFSDHSRPLDLAGVAKVSDHKQFKILTPKQMLQRLPIEFA